MEPCIGKEDESVQQLTRVLCLLPGRTIFLTLHLPFLSFIKTVLAVKSCSSKGFPVCICLRDTDEYIVPRKGLKSCCDYFISLHSTCILFISSQLIDDEI